MKHHVRYIDETQQPPKVIEANTARMAAWTFVHEQPRSDTSQVTVESQPAFEWRSPEITHYRACDLMNLPAPADDLEPELVIRLEAGRESTYVVSGSRESLRALGAQLLQSLDETPPAAGAEKPVYGVPVIDASGSRLEHYLAFEADPDIQQYWDLRKGLGGFRREYGRFLFFLLLTGLAGIGIWTVVQWMR